MQFPDPIIVDLFCGVGGLSLGAARAGFTVRGGVDTDSRALTAHATNFPKAFHLLADVSNLTGAVLRSSLGIKKGRNVRNRWGPSLSGISAAWGKGIGMIFGIIFS